MAKLPVKEGNEQATGLEKAWGKYNKRDFDGALNLFEEALEEKESDAALYGRACALFRSEEYDDALKDLSKLLKQRPDNVKYLHTRALVYGAEEKYKEAIRDLERAVEIDATAVEAWYDLGGTWLIRKEYAKANECFDTCIDLDKTCPCAWFGKGMVALEKKEYKRAIEYLNAAIKLDGKHLMALMARAEANFLLNQKKEAGADVAKIFSIDPKVLKPEESDSEGDDGYDTDDDNVNDDDYDSFKLDD